MKLRRSLYARPEIVRGEQCADARPGARCDTELPDRCGDDGRAGGLAIAERSLVAQPQAPAHRRGPGSGVRRAVPLVVIIGCPNAAVPIVRWPVRVSSGSAMACRMEVHVSAPDATGHAVSGSLSDRDVRLDAGQGTADIGRGTRAPDVRH
jgi:hypothetical protein